MGSVFTDKNGDYFKYINKDWITTATPSKIGYNFNPDSRTYSNISNDQFNQNYTANFYMVKVEGYVQDAGGFKFSDVTINFSNGAGSKKTNSDGYYFKYLDPNWSGTVTPTKDGYTFDPPYRNYSPVGGNRSGENYQISSPYFDGNSYATISGVIQDQNGYGIANVDVYFGSYYSSVKTDQNGYYSSPVIRKGWIGSATVSKDDYTFEPQVRTYSPLNTSESNQNYTGTSIYTFVSGWVRDDSENAIQGVNIQPHELTMDYKMR